jgi:hypothetical protein
MHMDGVSGVSRACSLRFVKTVLFQQAKRTVTMLGEQYWWEILAYQFLAGFAQTGYEHS